MTVTALDGRRQLPRSSTTEYATRGARARKGQSPPLRVVAPPRAERASRGVFVLIVVALLAAGFLTNLLINTSMAQGAFRIGDLQREATRLTEAQAVLREQVAALSAPTVLEAKARALGMVPTDSPVFLSVPDGKVIGQPAPAAPAVIVTDKDVEKKKKKKKNGAFADATTSGEESPMVDAATEGTP
jgi:hypothetical protein